MKIHHSITAERIQSALLCQGLDSPGFCVFCGAEAQDVEPDAREYECEACEEPGVYGAEELLIMTS